MKDLETIAALPTPERKPRTVKVRIAVAVDESGDWSAVGWKDGDDNAMESVGEHLDGKHQRFYWLTAELELPDMASAEVEAQVEDVE